MVETSAPHVPVLFPALCLMETVFGVLLTFVSTNRLNVEGPLVRNALLPQLVGPSLTVSGVGSFVMIQMPNVAANLAHLAQHLVPAFLKEQNVHGQALNASTQHICHVVKAHALHALA